MVPKGNLCGTASLKKPTYVTEGSQMTHVVYFNFWPRSVAYKILVSGPEWNPRPLQWNGSVES